MSELPQLGAEEEFHVVDLQTRRSAPEVDALLAQLDGAEFAPELQRSLVETNTPVCATLDELREPPASPARHAGVGGRAARAGRGRGGHRAARQPRRRRHLRGRALRTHAARVPAAGARAAHLRRAGARRRAGPGRRRAGRAPRRAVPPDAARDLRQLALLAGPGHRIRQLPQHGVVALADRGAARRRRDGRRLRRDGRRAHRVGHDLRPRNGLFRHPAQRAPAHRRAAGVRRLPGRRGRRAHRGPVPGPRRPRPRRLRGGPPAPAQPSRAAAREQLAGGPLGPRGRSRRPRGRRTPARRPPAADHPPRARPAATAGRARRLGAGPRAVRGDVDDGTARPPASAARSAVAGS